jgi:ABC-2 type transport system ATP-binding protein
LIFLDEPTTGLDPQSRRDLHAEIAGMKRDGHTVLLTTHNMDEAEHLCDRIAIMDRGRIVAAGAPRELIAQSTAAPSVFLATLQPINREMLAELPGVQDVTSDGSGFRFCTTLFCTTEVTRTLAELMMLLDARGVGIEELHVRKASLEDLLIELTGKK